MSLIPKQPFVLHLFWVWKQNIIQCWWLDFAAWSLRPLLEGSDSRLGHLTCSLTCLAVAADFKLMDSVPLPTSISVWSLHIQLVWASLQQWCPGPKYPQRVRTGAGCPRFITHLQKSGSVPLPHSLCWGRHNVLICRWQEIIFSSRWGGAVY